MHHNVLKKRIYVLYKKHNATTYNINVFQKHFGWKCAQQFVIAIVRNQSDIVALAANNFFDKDAQKRKLH